MCKLSCRSGHPPPSSPTFLPYYLSPSSFLLPHFPPLLPPHSRIRRLSPFTLTSLASLNPPSHPLPPSFHPHIPCLPSFHPHITYLPPSTLTSLTSLLPPSHSSPPSFHPHIPYLPPPTLTSLTSLLPPSHPLPPSFHSHIPHLPPSSLPTLTSLTFLPHLHVTFLSLPLSQGGLVFICGTLDGLIQILSRRHNTEDLIATVMAVEPHSFIYKGRWVCITHHTPITPSQSHSSNMLPYKT